MLKTAFRFGMLAVALMALLYLSKYAIFLRDMEDEIMLVIIAVLFIGFGVVISQLIKGRKVPEGIDEKQISNLGISQREYDVLNLMAEGKSNGQIADLLYISESTVKTHVSNLLVKLDAERRTEAVQLAKQRHII